MTTESTTPESPKMDWKAGRYNSSQLTLAGGFIKAEVHWSSVSRGEQSGYDFTCNDFKPKAGFLYPNMDAAKVAVEKLITRKLAQAAIEVAAVQQNQGA